MPQPRGRLFCFPHAGGSTAAFERWPEALPADIELWAAQLPGRPPRVTETAGPGLLPLLEGLEAELIPALDVPYAFFGHSMGAIVGFELTRRLRRRGLQLPTHLFVAGHSAPQIADDEEHLHLMSDEKLVDELRRLGGLPEPIAQDEDFLRFFLSIIRTDLTAIETWDYVAEPPLPVSIHALGGSEDKTVRRATLEAWDSQTNKEFSLHLFPGNHFFFDSDHDLVVNLVMRKFLHGT